MRRAVLWVLGGALAVFGALSVVGPASIAAWVDIQLASGAARADFRATYGGFEVGAAVFLIVCAARRDLTAIGLFAAGCIYAGFASGRLIGIVVDKPEGPLMLIVFVAEAAGAAAAFWMAHPAWRLPPADDPAMARRAA